MKPEPVRPLHGSILGGTEDLQTPTNIKQSWAGPSSLCPSDAARSQAGMGCQQQNLPCRGRTKPWNLLYRWKSRVISSRTANPQLLSQHQKETTRAPMLSKKQSPRWRCAWALSCTKLRFAHLGEPELPYGHSSNL